MSVLPQKRRIYALCLIIFTSFSASYAQQRRRSPAAGQRAVVVDERLSALRDGPSLYARLLQRLSRGRVLAILGTRRSPEGLTFYSVAVTRRTRGWVQADALVQPGRAGDDERLLRLVAASDDFDRIVRARLFLETFPKSPLRPAALALYAGAAEEAAAKLSREAARRLEEREMTAGGAPLFSYFLNYSGLDRYRRQEIVFTFDAARKQFYYDGSAWREILRRYPQSPEAAEARRRLETSEANKGR